MSTTPPPAADVVALSRKKVERDLQVSEGLLLAGIGLFAVEVALWWTGILATNGSPNFASQVLLVDALQGTAGVFILIGALFTVINWSLLRKPPAPSALRSA